MSTLTLAISADLGQFALAIDRQISLDGITGLFGHSGSGKSSVLKAIAGAQSPVTGRIELDGCMLQNSASNHYLAPHKRHIVGVFQQDNLFEHLNVFNNLMFGRKRLKQSTLDAEKIIDTAGLTPLLNKPIHQLSGGEKQRVALVQALLSEPKLLLLDEPMTALDRRSKTQLFNLIKSLWQLTKTPIIYVSHDIHEIQAMCATMYVLEQGKIINHGHTDKVIQQLNHSELIAIQTSLTLTSNGDKGEHGLYSYQAQNGDTIYGIKPIADTIETKGYILASDISICTAQPKQ